jgi:histidinol-phosphate aminotransferase
VSCDFIALANAGIQGLSPYQAGKPIEELQRELGLSQIIKLASNENPLPSSKKVIAACERVAADMSRYPDSNGFDLKAALANKLAVDPEQITLGNGSNDVLDLIARVFLQVGQSAIYSQHGFVVYPLSIQASGAKAIVTPALNWGHDLKAMLAAIEEDTRVIFIANPNNPTGTWLEKAALIEFLDQLPSNIIVVLDEAYIEYTEGKSFPNGVSLLKHYSNLIVTRTFSKAYGLAGLRVGYSVSSPDIADLLNRVRAPFNVNVMAMAAALAVLDDEVYLQAAIENNQVGMAQLTTGFEELDLRYIPSAGNFLAVDLPIDAMQVYQQLLEQGVIVRPVGVYEMPNHLRVTIGLPDENVLFLKALGKTLGR